MKNFQIFPLIALFCFAVVQACSSNDTAQQSGSTNNVEGAAPTESSNNDTNLALPLTASMRSTLDVLSRAYTSSQGVWTGFEVLEHPSVVVFRDARKATTTVVALNFPSLAVLGETMAVDVESAPYTAVQVTKLSNDLKTRVDGLQNFEFTANIGGISSYMIAVTEGEEGLSPETFDFGQYFIHEMFHRYQYQAFNVVQADQSLSNYPFSAENIELAILEERALKAALEADNNDQRDKASKHFAAIRVARRGNESRVDLDDSQETYEGTARFIEHRIAGDDRSVFNHSASFASNLITQPGENFSGIKQHFGFGRFYSSGAAIVEVIRRSGVEGYQGKIEAGAFASSVLISHLNLQSGDPSLVQDARSVYDSQGTLAALATLYSNRAAEEPDNFLGGDSENGPAGGETQLTPAQIQCFADLGYDITNANTDIPQNVIDQCLSS